MLSQKSHENSYLSMLTIIDSMNLYYSLMLIFMQKINFSHLCILEILLRNYKLIISRTLGIRSYSHQNQLDQAGEDFDVNLYSKILVVPSSLSWAIARIKQTCCFLVSGDTLVANFHLFLYRNNQVDPSLPFWGITL